MTIFERIKSRWRKHCNRRVASRPSDHPRRHRHPFVELLEDRVLLATVDLSPSKDNTLIEVPTSASQFLSDGAGQDFFVGRTKQQSGQSLRRGLIAFDVASSIPAGSNINSVSLKLNMSKDRPPTTTQTIDLHRVLGDWGEGTSDGTRGEGAGAPASAGDATWEHTAFNTSTWASRGGDFSATVSASASVSGVGVYRWESTAQSTAQMVVDVQGWLDAPSSNYGWVVLGDETTPGSAKRFDSRQNPTVANRPLLTVDYTPPMTFAAPSGNGPDSITLRLNGTNLEVVDGGGTIAATSPLASTRTIIISGADNEDDSLTVDFGSGGLFSLPGDLAFHGGGGGSDALRIIGLTTTSGVYAPNGSTDGSGTATVTAGAERADIRLDGLESVEVSGMGSYTLQTSSSDDVLTIDSAVPNQNRISGASGGVGFASLTFFNVPSFTIDAGDGSDRLTVRSASFSLPAEGQTLTFDGGSGTDRLVAAGGVSYTLTNASLRSPAGRLLTLSSIEEASLSGGIGAESLDASGFTAGPVTLDGGDGDDTLHGGSGNDVLMGGEGNDNLDGGPGSNTADFSHASKGIAVQLGTKRSKANGQGSDVLRAIENIIGSDFNDRITGDKFANLLLGGKGNDLIRGGAGNDSLDGGAGNDKLSGGLGHDSLLGGPGDDSASGDDGRDTIIGGDGSDTLTGGAGDDIIDGGSGNDRSWGDLGDQCPNRVPGFCGRGRDVIDGGDGNDTLRGGDGNDTIIGGPGVDRLFGDAGFDHLLVDLLDTKKDTGKDGGKIVTG